MKILAKSLLERRMVFDSVETIGDLDTVDQSHGAYQPVSPGNFVILGFQQIDAAQANLGCIDGKRIHRDVGVTPPAYRLVNAVLTLRDGSVSSPRETCVQTSGAGHRRFQERAPREIRHEAGSFRKRIFSRSKSYTGTNAICSPTEFTKSERIPL